MAELWGTSLVRRRQDGALRVLDFEASTDEASAREKVATAKPPVDERYFLAVARVEIVTPEPDVIEETNP